MAQHQHSGGLSRRDFLIRAGAAGIALPSMAAILAACQDSSQSTTAPTGSASANPYGTGGVAGAAYPLPRSDAPVTWNIPADNQPIDSGLPPEKGATLKIFNWGYYLKPSIMKDFGDQHDCKVELTTYHDLPDAFQKIRSGQVDFDLQFGMGSDYVGKYVAGKYLRPLNHDYLPNFTKNVWDQYKNPFYDQEARYTAPYGLSTTGIFWRNDLVKMDIAGMDDPYDAFWSPDAPRDKTHLLGDARDVLSLAMMRKGVSDVNTGDPAIIQQAHDDLLQVVKAVNPKWDNDDYTEVPQGQAWLHETWSGNAIDAYVFYLQPGQSPDVFSFVWPPAIDPSLPGVVGCDLIGVLSAGKNPVLAHMFLDHMFDTAVAMDNFSTYTGYQPPLKTIVPNKLVAQGVVPPNLESAIVSESDFALGQQLFELAPEVDALWQNAFEQLKAGV